MQNTLRMKNTFRSVIAFLGVSTAMSHAAPPPTLPQFNGLPYPQIVVDLTKGQNSFRFEASAYDPQPTDIVTISTVAFPSFMYLETTPGNPTYLAIGARDLTFEQVGFYYVFIQATDNEPSPVRVGNGFPVLIVPEPATGLAVLLSSALALLRRCR